MTLASSEFILPLNHLFSSSMHKNFFRYKLIYLKLSERGFMYILSSYYPSRPSSRAVHTWDLISGTIQSTKLHQLLVNTNSPISFGRAYSSLLSYAEKATAILSPDSASTTKLSSKNYCSTFDKMSTPLRLMRNSAFWNVQLKMTRTKTIVQMDPVIEGYVCMSPLLSTLSQNCSGKLSMLRNF